MPLAFLKCIERDKAKNKTFDVVIVVFSHKSK